MAIHPLFDRNEAGIGYNLAQRMPMRFCLQVSTVLCHPQEGHHLSPIIILHATA
jgi:hypothetical protein